MPRNSPPKSPPLPTGRVRVTRAAAELGLSDRTLRSYIAAGILTRANPGRDRGRGNAWLLWRDEVHVLMHEGRDACRNYRITKGRA